MNWKIVATVLLISTIALGALNIYQYMQYTTSSKLENVTFLLSWVPAGAYLPYYSAVKEGYYLDAGLSVSVISGKGSDFSISQVASEKVDFAEASLETLIAALESGSLPIKCIMVQFDHNDAGIASWAGPSIKDLENHTIALSSWTSLSQELPILMDMVGGNMNLVTIESSEPDVYLRMFVQKQVDAVAAYRGSDNLIINRELPNNASYYFINVMDYMDWYSSVILVNENTLKNKPDMVKRFLAATLKGRDKCFEDPQGAANDLVELVPDMVYQDAYDQWVDISQLIDRESGGHFNQTRLDSGIALIKEVFSLNPDVPEAMFTNDYLP